MKKGIDHERLKPIFDVEEGRRFVHRRRTFFLLISISTQRSEYRNDPVYAHTRLDWTKRHDDSCSYFILYQTASFTSFNIIPNLSLFSLCTTWFPKYFSVTNQFSKPRRYPHTNHKILQNELKSVFIKTFTDWLITNYCICLDLSLLPGYIKTGHILPCFIWMMKEWKN